MLISRIREIPTFTLEKCHPEVEEEGLCNQSHGLRSQERPQKGHNSSIFFSSKAWKEEVFCRVFFAAAAVYGRDGLCKV